MAQSVNLSIAGIYTSGNDYNGLPPGALDAANNVESRYKNTLEPRRGFNELTDSDVALHNFPRITNFYVLGTDSTIGLNDSGALFYYKSVNIPNPWTALPGSVSTGIVYPNATNGKSRFIKAGQNLYLTSQEGIRSLSSGSSAQMIRSGVPKGLNLQAAVNNDVSGFFANNSVLVTTGNLSSGSANLTTLASSTGISIGQYVSGTNIPAGTTVTAITDAAPVNIETGNLTSGSSAIANVISNAGLSAGVFVSATGIPSGTVITSVSGGGPYTVNISANAFITATGATITFTTPAHVTMSANATGSSTATTVTFYAGAQVAYCMVFGRTETDINGINITRLGAPSSVAIASNILGTSTNVTVIGTIPKNASHQLTFVQLYRSPQTASINISPLTQYDLVYERPLVAGDFTTRTVTITDIVTDALVGAALYSGSDQEGILQSNNPPPMCWDMCPFRNFMIYANCTQPSTLKVTILAVGSPSGVQINDTITMSGSFAGVSFTRTYTGKSTESQSAAQFAIVTSGTPSQNITDTAQSLIRVINYDNNLPVHAIYLSSSTDLPGQIELESDYPSLDVFNVTASAHTTAYDPTLSNVDSTVNTLNNGIYVSKSGELEAVPALNLLRAGDTSSSVYRVVPLRDYVFVIKSDGVYKLQGLTPDSLVISPFDLTTKIIGADTAVSLNSGVWMFSNQGVVSISDSGVDAKSVPIDNQLNLLIGTYLDNVTDVSFGVGYESDRKYILSVPDATNPYTETQHIFNYVTNAWTTWTRNIRWAFIHSNDGKLYISRADINSNGVSKERKTGTYQDYVDESFDVTITAISGANITLDSVTEVVVGDILYQSGSAFSPITAVNLLTNVVTVQTSVGWSVAAASIQTAYLCSIAWKQVFGDNPAFVRQFSEGLALFKNTRFNTATLDFTTDFSPTTASVTINGPGNGFWGLFGWGNIPWGGVTFPQNIRFLIPQDKQLGSYLLPVVNIQQGYSNFKIQGLSISYTNISQEVGK